MGVISGWGRVWGGVWGISGESGVEKNGRVFEKGSMRWVVKGAQQNYKM